MSIPGAGNPLLLGGAGGYKIERSLRFNPPDSASLSRTPASAGNRKTWTWAGWVKRAKISSGNYDPFFSAGSGFWAGGDQNQLLFNTSDFLYAFDYNSSGSFIYEYTSSRVFRDPAAWYHIVFVVDTTQATAANRVKLYVNGVQDTNTASTAPALNADTKVNNTVAHYLGAAPSYYGGLYLADVHFIDGQALTPSSFGETDINGVWQPKAYSGGSYGTNGFKLAFADNSAATATTLGKDTSGNGNNWTPNNLSVTAGAGNDSLVDSPTNYGSDTGAGGEVRGNYCTLNPLTVTSPLALANGNLEVSDNTTSAPVALGTIAVNAGKWYWEVTIGSTYCYIGAAKVTSRSSVGFLGSVAGQFIYNNSNNALSYIDGSIYNYSTGSTSTTNDVIGVALNFDSNQITFYKNGVSMGVFGSNILGTDLWAPAFKTNAASSAIFNFGQRQWAYTPPAGFKALCTQNLPAPTITKPSTVMDVKLYTGNGSTQTISGLGFSPDFVWVKSRSSGTWGHILTDIVRGGGYYLSSNTTAAESGGGASLIRALTLDGFTVNVSPNGSVNNNGDTYVAWNWSAGSSIVTNPDGTISSQVRANASAGFSIVTYMGNGTNNSTVGHGLGVAPTFLIGMDRTGGNWQVWGANMNNGSFDCVMNLNTADPLATGITTRFRAASSSTFTIGTDGDINGSGNTYVTYCFAPVAGYSAFGSYTGNGNADGPFIYTGFRPRWVMIKNTGYAGQSWWILDTARDDYNVTDNYLQANNANAEGTFTVGDILSNGFKIRTTDFALNRSGDSFIYAAFAEAPFALARAR